MKTIFLSFFLIVACVANAQNQQNSEDFNFCTESGSGNIILDPVVGKKMVDAFRSYYLRDDETRAGIDTIFWLSKNDIMKLNSFINRPNSLYDGVSIIFGATNTSSKKTSMYVVPTLKVNTPTGRPVGQSHDEDWGTLTLPSGNYTPKKAAVVNDKQRFYDVFVKGHAKFDPTQTDTLSTKVWIDACVIQSIVNLFGLVPEIKGINVNMAAYYGDANDASIGQIRPHQSTIVLVTSTRAKQNNWEITQKVYNHYFTMMAPKTDVTKLAAFNHSQLCPQICN